MLKVFGGRIGVEELIDDLPIRAEGSMSGMMAVVCDARCMPFARQQIVGRGAVLVLDLPSH